MAIGLEAHFNIKRKLEPQEFPPLNTTPHYDIRKTMKTALVHDWIVDLGGAEKVLKEIWSLFPGKIHTLVFKKEGIEKMGFDPALIRGSFLMALPKVERFYRHCLPLYPLAIEQLDLSEFNLIISTSHAVAKGVLTRADQLHICYCHTPMRYAWDLYHEYMKGVRRGQRLLARMVLHYLRQWDVASSNRVDCFVANSQYIARRIWKTYRREAKVVYPPVDVKVFTVGEKKEDFYLAASRMVPYKRMAMIVEAFSRFLPERRLVVIGDGPEMKRVKAAAGMNVEILGYQPPQSLKKYLQRARAFVFAAREDFGILPVEAQACGTPVIAYGEGGTRETVLEGETGVFFYEQTPQGIAQGVKAFENFQGEWDPYKIRQNAERFSKERFHKEFKELVEEEWERFQRRSPK